MEWESDSPCHSHTYSGQGHRSAGRHRSWEVEFRDCGAIPGWELLLTEERWIEGMWGGRLWRKMPVEESQVAMEPRWYCWVTRRGWSYHHSRSFPWQSSISSWTIERLAQRVPEALNCRVGSHPGCSFKWLMCQYRVGSQPGGLSMCLMQWTAEKDPR